MADRLLWVDGFQTTKALSSLLMCSAAFLAPFDEQSPTSVNLPVVSQSSQSRGMLAFLAQPYALPRNVMITIMNVRKISHHLHLYYVD